MRTLRLFLAMFALLTGLPSAASAWGWMAYANAGSSYDVPTEAQAVAASLPDVLEPWRPTFRFVGNDSGFSIIFGQRDDSAAPFAMTTPEALGLRLAPNPIRDKALLSFTLPLSGITRLSLIDVRGRVVQTLFHESLRFGAYEHRFAPNVPAGQYVLRLTVDKKQASMKVVVVH